MKTTLKKPKEVLIWLLSSTTASTFLKHLGNFYCSPMRNTPPQSQLVIFSSDKQEFLPISHVVNKKWPLKLCACLWVLREVDFPSHKLNTLWTQRTGVHPQHFPRCSNITCLMEFPSYNLTAETKSNEQVLQSCRWLTGSFGFVFFFMLGVLRLAFSILVFLSM